MVSSRQREAQKRFKEANPDRFPKPEPTPPKDPNKKKKKKDKDSKFKRKKSSSSDPNKPKSAHRKSVLRVPGMRPGESCFICKAPDHIAKNCPQKSEWERNKICLGCRSRGHSLKNCPNKNEETVDRKLCYNCGETGHSLSGCPQPLQEGGTKYASCFICNEIGHLSKDCPKNTHGIYPKGGSCKICGGVTHLARDCPNKSNQVTNRFGVPRQSFELQNMPNRVTKLLSGDDLEDDFVEPAPTVEEKDNNTKTKNKQGPKVVNFLG